MAVYTNYLIIICCRCQTEDNICFKGSLCINHYNQLSCDCFGTLYEDEYCDIYGNKLFCDF